jgi:hypothetical protein
MATEGMERSAFAPALPGDALPRQRHRLIFPRSRIGRARRARDIPWPVPWSAILRRGVASGSRGWSTASGTSSGLTNPNDVLSRSAAPFRASGPGPTSMPDITNPGVASGEGLAISAWAAARPRCQSSLAGFLFAHAVCCQMGRNASVVTPSLGGTSPRQFLRHAPAQREIIPAG